MTSKHSSPRNDLILAAEARKKRVAALKSRRLSADGEHIVERWEDEPRVYPAESLELAIDAERAAR